MEQGYIQDPPTRGEDNTPKECARNVVAFIPYECLKQNPKIVSIIKPIRCITPSYPRKSIHTHIHVHIHIYIYIFATNAPAAPNSAAAPITPVFMALFGAAMVATLVLSTVDPAELTLVETEVTVVTRPVTPLRTLDDNAPAVVPLREVAIGVTEPKAEVRAEVPAEALAVVPVVADPRVEDVDWA